MTKVKNKNAICKLYFDYFNEIEGQLTIIKKYIYFDKNNFRVYSFELLKLLQIICAEIDTIAKILSKDEIKIEKNKFSCIRDWGFTIQNVHSKEIYVKLLFDETNELQPYASNWKYEKHIDKKGKERIRLCNNCKSLEWWNAYNKVKHQRVALLENDKMNFAKATLKNVANAFGGLYILERILAKKYNCEEMLKSELLTVCNY